VEEERGCVRDRYGVDTSTLDVLDHRRLIFVVEVHVAVCVHQIGENIVRGHFDFFLSSNPLTSSIPRS
jgi:hypothetical protein